jgi:hypothetical protein
MDKKGTYVIAAILVVALIGFAIISLQKSTLDTKPDAETASTTVWENTPADVVVTPKTVITAKHAWNGKDTHTIAGEVPLPTPCDVLDESVVVSPDKKQVVVQFVSSVKTGERCPSDITPARFKVTAKADKTASLTATLNGQPVTLNLIEAAPGENLDDFELYIKG